MANEWKKIELGAHCSKIGSGATPRGGSQVYLDSGKVALIRSQNVYNEGFSHSGLTFIKEEHSRQLSNVSVEEDDILLNITGDSVARCCQVAKDVLPARVNQHVAIIRPCSKTFDPKFLRYFLISPKHQSYMLSLSHAGATRKALTKGMIESFKIPKPSLNTQKAIAHILGTLDDKIELNRQMNCTLEAMAQSIFKSWFIDFDPVHAKAEGRDTGLPKDIAKLFPSSFQDSELGKIPKGWEVKTVGEVVECVGGATPSTKKASYWDGGTNPFLTPKDMSSLESVFILETSRHITDEGVCQISSRLIPKWSVILSSRAPIGYLTINTIPLAVNQGVIAMICHKKMPNYYVYMWLKANMDVIKSKACGTTFAEISKKNFRPISFLVPSSTVIVEFTRRIEPIFEQIVNNLILSKTLEDTRDRLLPKLLAGEIVCEGGMYRDGVRRGGSRAAPTRDVSTLDIKTTMKGL